MTCPSCEGEAWRQVSTCRSQGKEPPLQSCFLLQGYPTVLLPGEGTGHGLRRLGPKELKGPFLPGWVLEKRDKVTYPQAPWKART